MEFVLPRLVFIPVRVLLLTGLSPYCALKRFLYHQICFQKLSLTPREMNESVGSAPTMRIHSDPIREAYGENQSWGIWSGIDLHGCNAATIRDAQKIKEFVYELCNKIAVIRYGECTVVHFGEDPRVSGFSMVQLIETSLISGHFANQTNAVYLDVFSCKYYDPHVVADFAKEFFEAKDMTLNYTLRK